MTTFQQMNLPPRLYSVLEAMNFVTPTPIQSKAIPAAFSGRDLVGCAQTGTGKTAAFCIPILVRLAEREDQTALILAPTRELAVQIHKVVEQLGAAFPELSSVLLIGGAPMPPQVRALKKNPRIIVATPGRLLDHLQQGTASVSAVGFLVLDEADRMLDMGFAPQLARIRSYLPATRQTFFFSATFPESIRATAVQFLKNPLVVTAGPASRPIAKIRQSVIETTLEKKNDVLLDELGTRDGSVLIFTRTRRRTDRIARYLSRFGHSVARIHGDRNQSQRDSAIREFRSGSVRILVATDIAARGLDIPKIAHVINYDLPQLPEDYVHRIGRTARAGADGASLSLVLPEDRTQWRRIASLCAPPASPAGFGQMASARAGS